MRLTTDLSPAHRTTTDHTNTVTPRPAGHRRPTWRRGLLLLTALALLGTACGSSSDDGAAEDTSAETATDTEATDTDTTDTEANDTDTTGSEANDGTANSADTTDSESSGSASSGAGSSSAGSSTATCSTGQLASGGYLVTNIPAGDADGGLVMRSAAGSASTSLGVLPEGSSVFPGPEASDCVVLDGAVWWQAYDEAGPFWVHSGFLGKYPETGTAAPIGTTAALCESYRIVMDTRETDAFPTQDLMQLDAELGFSPTGVSGSIANLLNGTGSGADYDAIAGYVGPICDGDASAASDWDAAPLADVAQACLGGDGAACDTIAGFTMSPEGALARAFVEAAMAGDTATLAQLAPQEVVEGNTYGGAVEPGYGAESLQLDGSSFSYVPFPTGATTCQIVGTMVASCTYHP